MTRNLVYKLSSLAIYYIDHIYSLKHNLRLMKLGYYFYSKLFGMRITLELNMKTAIQRS